MIWEVDEDCDQALTWPEFQAMYQRCRNDQTGAHGVPALPASARNKAPACTDCTGGVQSEGGCLLLRQAWVLASKHWSSSQQQYHGICML